VLDLEELSQRVERASCAYAPDVRVGQLRPLFGGASSLTFLADLQGVAPGDRRIVVKVAPPGLEPVRHRDVLRQARLLRVLAGTDAVAVPVVLAQDAGDPPAVPPFFTMTLIPGESVEPHIYPAHAPMAPEQLTSRAVQASQILAAMHRLDLDEMGLAEEPVVDLTTEVGRWVRLIGTAEEESRVGADACAEALLAALPEPSARPVLQHGDYRLGNMLCEGSDVRAVIDWEIWAIGDPRVDLGWFLSHADAEHHASATCDAPGMPRPAALLAAYESALGSNVVDLNWFLALAQFKMAAVMAGMLKLNRRREHPDPAMDSRSPQVRQMISYALELLASAS
jgi:aminoglycoside phosphotransferase (APT) family kinase protein